MTAAKAIKDEYEKYLNWCIVQEASLRVGELEGERSWSPSKYLRRVESGTNTRLQNGQI